MYKKGYIDFKENSIFIMFNGGIIIEEYFFCQTNSPSMPGVLINNKI